MTQETFINKVPHAQIIKLQDQVATAEKQASSKTLVQRSDLGLTLFSLAEGQSIRTHTTPGDALVQVLEGTAKIIIGEETYFVKAGESIVMPAGIPHSLDAEEAFKMLLMVVKAKAPLV